MKSLFVFMFLIGPFQPHQYLGPETLMPLASVLAAIAGFFLIFWRLIVRVVKATYRKIRGIPDEVPPDMEADEAVENDQNK